DVRRARERWRNAPMLRGHFLPSWREHNSERRGRCALCSLHSCHASSEAVLSAAYADGSQSGVWLLGAGGNTRAEPSARSSNKISRRITGRLNTTPSNDVQRLSATYV